MSIFVGMFGFNKSRFQQHLLLFRRILSACVVVENEGVILLVCALQLTMIALAS